MSEIIESRQKRPDFRKLYILAFALLSFSYPITTVIIINIGADASYFNFLFKGLISVLFALSFLTIYPFERNIFSASLQILIFFFIYSFRILYDTLSLGIVMGEQSLLYVYSYFFILTFIPMIVISLTLRAEDIFSIHRSIFVMLIIANLALFFHVVSGGILTAEEAFGSRLQVDGDEAGTALLNPIIVGFMGAVLSVFTIGRLATFKNMSISSEVFHLALIALGTLNVMFGGSRGPMVAYALCMFVIMISAFRSGTSAGGFKLRGRIWVYAALLVSVLTTLAFSANIEIQVFERFEDMFDDRTGRIEEERDFIWALAWDGFLSSPIFGSSYAVWSGGEYVSAHNIFLDALNATGIVGGIFLTWALVKTAIGMARLTNGSMGPYGFSLALTGVCFLTLSFTSGSISQNPDLWIYITMISLLGSLGYKKPFEQINEKNVTSSGVRAF